MKCHSRRIDVISYDPYILSFRPFKLFFQQLHLFLQLGSFFIKWYEKERSIKRRALRIQETFESAQYELEIDFTASSSARYSGIF